MAHKFSRMSVTNKGCEGNKTALLQAEAGAFGLGLQMCCFVRGLLFSLMRPKGAKSVGEKI